MNYPHSGLETVAPLSTGSAPCNKVCGGGRFWGPRRLGLSSRLVLVCMELSSNNYQKTHLYPTSFLSPTLIHLPLPLDPILLTFWFPPIVPFLSPFR